jgi:hypothetical protein
VVITRSGSAVQNEHAWLANAAHRGSDRVMGQALNLTCGIVGKNEESIDEVCMPPHNYARDTKPRRGGGGSATPPLFGGSKPEKRITKGCLA